MRLLLFFRSLIVDGIFGVYRYLLFLCFALPLTPFIPPHSVVILLPQRTRVLFCRLLYSLPFALCCSCLLP
jgi:hypothetical protein